jgi:acetyl-CoA carboxylase biotin carboxyl carrier protein
MTIEEIKQLLELFNASGIGELEIQRGEDRLRLRRDAPPAEVPPAPASAGVPAAAQVPAPSAEETVPEDTLIRSPIVGTYYDAASPGAPPFVKPGDRVEPGQVLCIIESMKLMNEIEAESAGVITAKLVENGRAVEYGEALFSLRPR